MNYTSSSTGPASTGQSITDLIHAALQRYIPERCHEITRILQQASHKELHVAFQYLVENIFRVEKKSQSGWGLLELSRNQRSHDFACVLEFLSSKGPLLDVAYKLLADGRAHYQFPISCLPATSRKMLEDGKIPPLYAKKIAFCGLGKATSHITLNPVEYYYFHFAYFVVSPSQSKDSAFPSALADSLYPSLLENYLRYLLPTDGSTVPDIPHSFHTPYSRPIPYSSIGWSTTPSEFYSSPQQNIFQKHGMLTSTPLAFHQQQQQQQSNSYSQLNCSSDETWRSQMLLLTLLEFWLSLSSDSQSDIAFDTNFQEAFVPSHIQMQLVRLLIKHLHYFTNSALDPNDSSSPISELPYQTQNPLQQFKRSLMTQHVQKKVYQFLKLSFERWPLDCYFRLVLETWLSYIQPWRYVASESRSSDDVKQDAAPVQSKWSNFVCENLLAYSGLFQKLIPRFMRLELHNVRNAYLLLRVTKVFSQVNLQELIVAAEKNMNEPALVYMGGQVLESNGLGRSPGHAAQELEGTSFRYQPIFGATIRSKVMSLLMYVSACRAEVQKQESQIKALKRSWWSSLFQFDSQNTQEHTVADINKTIAYLDLANSQLCTMFRLSGAAVPTQMIESPLPCEETIFSASESVLKSAFELDISASTRPTTIPELPVSPRNIGYHGNPDLQPIRTFEVAFLVRLFYHIALIINQKYQNDINNLYCRQDWIGHLSRQLLAPPTVCRSCSGGDTLALPPRVSLRTLAHGQLLAYLSATYILAYLFGYGLFTFLLFIGLVVFAYAGITAILCP